jgi:two-component system chemotaxis sensor kinase CheA
VIDLRQARERSTEMSIDSGQKSGAPNTASVNPLASDPELIGDFIMESREHLTAIELQLLTLDQDPANAEAIHAIFRGFHTIKGMAGFLDLDAVRELAHEVETVLDLARNGKLGITSTIIDRILESKDYLNVWMTDLESMLRTGKTSTPPEAGGLLEAIRGLVTGGPDVPASAAPATPGLTELAREVAAPPPENLEAAKTQEARHSGAQAIKVETAKLDYLVDMVGEMVISQSLVRHDPDLATGIKPRLARNLSQLARITDDIQRTAMSMRMIPVGQLFQKTSRLVRDLSRKVGKQVELELAGEDTELDRNIVEELADPLMHMVRNSVDHGIELPEERVAAGKPAQAHVTLKAGHQAGHIVIQVSDDGRGLAREKILRKARERNLIEAGVTDMPESEIFNLIFHPGFSTADKITDVSGRGVGMDVVRKQVQKLRGRIDVISKPGEGTTFLLKLPLTLAIIDGLVVGVGDQRYIIPIFAVREMFKPAEQAISTIHGRQEMAMVRGTLIPVIRLHQRFNVKPRNEHPWESLLVVAESGNKLFCLMVDELIGKQEVVIKSLGEGMRHIPGVAGGAILGDGRVGLILDPEGLFGASNGRSHGE